MRPSSRYHQELLYARLLVAFSACNAIFCVTFVVLDIQSNQWLAAGVMIVLALINIVFTFRINTRTLRRIRARGIK